MLLTNKGDCCFVSKKKNLHQDKLQNEHDESTNYVMHLRFLAKFMTERFANGERCPCALCTK